MPTQVRLTRLGVGQQLAQLRPTNTSAASAYSPGDDISTRITSIIVCNVTGSSANYRIFHDEDGSTYTQNTALFYDVALPGNTTDIIEIEMDMIDTNGNLGVRTSTANSLVFTVYGEEVRRQAR